MKKVVCSTVVAVSLAFSSIAFADPQPVMKEGLEQLQKAKETLKKGTTDKGGHRVKAIELIDKAIEQLEKGIKFDNKN